MSALAPSRPQRIELVCFAALAALASLQWASLVADPPTGRVALAVVLATGAGAALAAIARLRLARPAGWALGGRCRPVAASASALVFVGLPARLLLPGNWGELARTSIAASTGSPTSRCPTRAPTPGPAW